MEVFKRLMPMNFNDFLCLFLMSCIFALWFLDGYNIIELDSEVQGGTIAFFMLIANFYYRKAKGEDKTNGRDNINSSR